VLKLILMFDFFMMINYRMIDIGREGYS